MISSKDSPSLECALKRYHAALTPLEASKSHPSEEQTLNVLIARNEVHSALTGTTQPSAESLTTLIKLDDRLKQQAKSITRVIPRSYAVEKKGSVR